MGTVTSVPSGYHTATPYLTVDGAAGAIDFYTKVFGAIETMRIAGPDGKIGHAEIKIGTSAIMLADEHPDLGARGPKSLGGTPVGIVLYVDDVDAVAATAVAAGAALQRPVTDKFYGDRSGTIVDPFGHIWHVATHIEDVPADELHRRAAALHPS